MLEFFLKRFIWITLRSLMLTYRFSYRHPEYLIEAKNKSPNGTYIFALWHELVWPTMAAHAWTEPYMGLASRSKDGNYAAYISTKLGLTTIRGSSRKGNKDKGGKEAMQAYVHGLKNKSHGGITVDGPKGPRRICKTGILLIAKESGSPIVPVGVTPTSYWEIPSWDKMKIPKPFSKILVEYGEPIFVNSDQIEEFSHIVTEKLNQVTI